MLPIVSSFLYLSHAQEEIAEDLRVRVATVREWIRQKKLKAAKFGRDYRIKRKDYEEFIEQHYNVDDGEQKQ